MGDEMFISDTAMDMFNEMDNSKESVTWALEMCRSPNLIAPVDGNDALTVSVFVRDCIMFLFCLLESSSYGKNNDGVVKFQIDSDIARQLIPIYQILSTSTLTSNEEEEDDDDLTFLMMDFITTMLENNTTEDGFSVIVDEISKKVPSRGELSKIAGYVLINSNWAQLSPHIEKLCEVVSSILMDPWSMNETNGLCLWGLSNLIRFNPNWIERMMELVLDAIRDCHIRGQLERSIEGDLSQFLMNASEMISKNNNNGSDPYEYFMKMYVLDPRGIANCNCTKHGSGFPKLVCRNLISDALEEEIADMVNQTDEAISNSLYSVALEMTTSILNIMETNMHTLQRHVSRHERHEIHCRIGRCHYSMNDFESAVDSFMRDYFLDQSYDEIWYAHSAMKIEAILYTARSLANLGRKNEAIAWANQVAEVEVPDDVRSSKEEMTNEAIRFIESLRQDRNVSQGQANITIIKEQTNSPLVVQAAESLKSVHCWVRQCSWYSMGSVEDSHGECTPESFVVDRLNWVLVWVRGRLLVWDYKKNEVVQYITLSGRQTLCDWKCFDTTPTSTICIFFTTQNRAAKQMGDCFVILLDELDLLPRGATNSADIVMCTTLGKHLGLKLERKEKFTRKRIFGRPINFDSWHKLCSGMCKEVSKAGGYVAGFDAIKNTESWSLALFDSNMYSLGATNEILVYCGHSKIAKGAALGPLALLTEKPSLILSGHSKSLRLIGFVPSQNDDDTKFLISTANDSTIKVWNLIEEECMHTIRDFKSPMGVHLLTYSPTLLFGSRFASYEDIHEKELKSFSSHIVEIFEIKSAEHLVTLQHDEAVENLQFDKDLNILFVTLRDGSLHVWRIDQGTSKDRIVVSHLHGLKLFSDDHGGNMITHLNLDRSIPSIIVSTMKELILLCNPSQTEVNRVDGTAFNNIAEDGIGKLQNCGYCYRYKFTSKSNMCAGCKKIRFCNIKCQKKGWKEHKPFCLSAA